MKFLKSDQVYYSLANDADYCARAVADLIRADIAARGTEWQFERMAHRMNELGFQIGKQFDKVIREAVDKILNMKWEL